MAPAQSQSLRPVTRAKNATQHPGLVNAQQKRRSVAEMAKVRSEERLNKKLTEQRLYAALKKVAKVQDQNHDEDIEANIPILAPSLRRHETRGTIVTNTADGDITLDDDLVVAETESVNPVDEDLDEDDPPVPVISERQAEINSWYDFGSDLSTGEQPPKKKKKKGDGTRELVGTLRKNPPARENPKVNINVFAKPTNKVPPPRPKGKQPQPRSLCVFIVTWHR